MLLFPKRELFRLFKYFAVENFSISAFIERRNPQISFDSSSALSPKALYVLLYSR